jgi:hypothetical protein
MTPDSVADLIVVDFWALFDNSPGKVQAEDERFGSAMQKVGEPVLAQNLMCCRVNGGVLDLDENLSLARDRLRDFNDFESLVVVEMYCFHGAHCLMCGVVISSFS